MCNRLVFHMSVHSHVTSVVLCCLAVSVAGALNNVCYKIKPPWIIITDYVIQLIITYTVGYLGPYFHALYSYSTKLITRKIKFHLTTNQGVVFFCFYVVLAVLLS